ncbi:hypothetical protein CDAR_210751, partial [Caerostris darwini]
NCSNQITYLFSKKKIPLTSSAVYDIFYWMIFVRGGRERETDQINGEKGTENSITHFRRHRGNHWSCQKNLSSFAPLEEGDEHQK